MIYNVNKVVSMREAALILGCTKQNVSILLKKGVFDKNMYREFGNKTLYIFDKKYIESVAEERNKLKNGRNKDDK